jgi:REDY-like protein HapK
MANLILLYKLKDGIDRATFEKWVLTTDYPTMRGLKRVASYANHRVVSSLMGGVAPSVDYIEIFDIPDLAGFMKEDMGSAVVQGIMGQFMGFAATPEFLIVDEMK